MNMNMTQVKGLRKSFESFFLVESCSLIRRTEHEGTLGTSEATFAIYQTGIKCSIESRTQRDSRSHDKQVVNVGNEYLLKLSFDQEVFEKDIFRLTNKTGDQADYAIKPVYEHKVEAGILKKLVVEKLSYLTKIG